MKFAIGILIVLVFACTLGSVIPQGNVISWYTRNYSEQIAGAIMLFGLDDVFHSWWFVLLTVILCANLLGCNLIHFPKLMKRYRNGFQAQARVDSSEKAVLQDMKPDETPAEEKDETGEGALVKTAGAPAGFSRDPGALFASLGFRRIEEVKTASGRSAVYSVRNKIGIWGAWLCHLGMLIVIAGFALGQSFQTETSVYGVPGQTRPVEGTPYTLTIDDFEIGLREDETVEQYTASLTMTDTESGRSQSGKSSVNSPLSLFGYRLYQNSTGWAATVEISKEEEVLQEEILCAGEYVPVKDMPDLVITLAAFYPDYAPDEQGRPMTVSSALKNPAYLYRIYYKDQVLGMNVLTGDDVITVEDYVVRFKDPQNYTLIQIKRDPFTPVAAAGGLLVLLSLILAFYLRTAEIWAIETEEGKWAVWGFSRKGGREFLDAVRENCGRQND